MSVSRRSLQRAIPIWGLLALGSLLGVAPSAHAQIATGTYTGDGSPARGIAVGFAPDIVMIKVDDGSVPTPTEGVIRTSTMSGTKGTWSSVGLQAGYITSLTATGFVVGNDIRVNALNSCGAGSDPCVYYWTAFKADLDIEVGTYVGDGNATQAIGGVTFSPEYVIVMGDGAYWAYNRTNQGTTESQRLRNGGTPNNGIPSLDPNGFTVGNTGSTTEFQNDSGVTYHYIAFNDRAGKIDVGGYPGTGASQNITGIGFQPEFVMVQAWTTANQNTFKSDQMGAAESTDFASAVVTNRITALLADGFTVSGDSRVGDAAESYGYVAFNAGPGTGPWTLQTSGTTRDQWAVHFPLDTTTGFSMGASGEIFDTGDGGLNWNPIFDVGSNILYGVQFPVDGVTGYAAASSENIWKTSDSGASWVNVYTGGGSSLRDVCFLDNNTGYVVGRDQNIQKTTNGGGMWTQQFSGSFSFYSCSFPIDETTGYTVGSSGKVFKTTNSGTLWSEVFDVGSTILYGVHFPVDNMTGYAVGEGGEIYKTTNGGALWTLQPTPTTVDLFAVEFPVDALTGYAVGDSGIVLKTTDGGANWFIEITPTTENLRGIHFPTDDVTGWAVGANGTIMVRSFGGGSADLTQSHYRWRNDDGGEGDVDTVQVSDTVDTTTVLGSYEVVSGMTITPGAGDYLVWFSGSLESTAGGSTQNISLFVDGSQITHTEREILTEGSIPDTPFNAVTHAFLPGVTAGQAINVRWRTSGGTATMHERTLTVTRVNAADITQVTATGDDTTGSAAYTPVTGMSITPGVGDYLVWFSGSVNGDTNTTEQQVSLFVNGVQVAHTERRSDQEDSLTNTYFPVALHARLTGVGAAEAIDVRWQTSGGTATMRERTLTVYRMNPADNAQASGTLDDTTVSATWTPVDSMSLTPGAGDYRVWFSSSLEGTTANSVQDVALYVNGIQVAHTLRNFLVESSLIDTFQSFPVALQAYVTGVGAADVIDVRWQTSGGTATMHERTLVVDRLQSVSGATFAAAEDTKLTALTKNTLKRVRFEVSNEGAGGSGPVAYELQFAETATCSAGTYTTVPTVATDHWQVIDSSFITDGQPSSNVTDGLTDDATTFVAGEAKDTGNTTGSITLASDEFTEIEFSVQALAAATNGGDYCFRLYDATNNQVLDTYLFYAEVSLAVDVLTQGHYRWRDDNGGEAAATWAAAEDTPLSPLEKGILRRVRLGVSNEGTASSGGVAYELQVAETATCSAGVYTAVPIAATGHWQVFNSSFIADGEPSSNVAGGLTDDATTFVAGEAKDAGNPTSSLTLAPDEFTEIEFAVQATSNATDGGDYCFRLYDATNNEVLDTYTVYAQVTLATDVLTQGHYRWRNDDGGEGSVDNFQVSETVDTMTTGGSYELVSGMTITPGAGDYLVWFSGSLESTTGSSTQHVSLFVDTGQITHTEREVLTEGSIPDTPFTAVTHAFLPGVTAGQAINVRWRTTGGTATMHERTLAVTRVNPADVTQVSATANDTTTSAAYTAVTGMSITPGAGDYLVWFSGSVNGDTNTTEQQVSLFVNGVQVAHTERRADQEDSLVDTYFPVALHARLTSVGAAEAIDVRWQTSGGTATMAERTLTVYQINPADSAQASATLDDTTVSATWTPVDSMALTPGAGDYLVWFSSSLEGTTANSVQDVALYVNGIQVAHTVRSFLLESSLTDTFQSFPVALHAYVTGVGAADVIDVRWQTSAGTATMHERTLVVQRVTNPSGATFAAAEDTKLTGLAKSTIKRVRFEISNGGTGSSGAVTYELQVAETATCSAGTFTTVPTAATGHWQVIDSGFITDGEPTFNITPGLTDGATTFVSGESKDTGNTTGSITLASDEFTEIEFSIQALAAATDAGDYCFRLYDATNSQVLDTYSVYAEVQLGTPPTDVTVSASGTQTAGMFIPSTDQYVGGKFVIRDNTGSRNITGITITESGTVDALNNLDNIKLFYELDTTAPYDGASESYGGGETQFGVTDTNGFSAVNGISSFTDTVAISTTSTLVVYVVFDVGAGATPGETVEISINDPSTEVTASAGTVGPATPVAISGTTTLSAPPAGVIFYSVGTDNTALYSDTASASSGTLTLNSAAIDKIGVGDEIREGANRYYITGRNSATEFTIQNSSANGGTPGDTNITFASTAITIFRAFNDLATATTGSADANHLATSDLVAGNFQLNWACYNDGPDPSSGVRIQEPWVTGPANYIRVFTPTDASEVGTSQRHSGVSGTGYRIAPTEAAPGEFYSLILVSNDNGYVRIEGIEIDGSNVTNTEFVRGIQADDGAAQQDVRISHSLIHDLTSSTFDDSDLSESFGIVLNNTTNAKVSNNIIYNITTESTNASSGAHGIEGRFVGRNHYIYNNTVYNILNTGNTFEARGIRDASGGTLNVRNNYVGLVDSTSGAESCYLGAFVAENNNVSSDATAGGAGSQINESSYATYFVNTTAGSEDLHLLNDSNTLWGSFGADLDSDANLPVTDDIDGEARDATQPDIGADEAAPAAVVFYSVGTDNTALYSDTASASAGTLTLNSAAVDKIGVGDEIREGANRYYITGRNSATEFTIQNSAANGGTPGDTNITFASTAVTIFRAFNDLDTATSGSADSNHLNTSDLVTGSFQLNWACYNDGPDPSVEVKIEEPWVTGPANYIRVFTPTDSNQVGISQRHTGVAGTGYRIAPTLTPASTTFEMLQVSTDFGHVRVEGIELDGSNVTGGDAVYGIDLGDSDGVASDDIRISHCIIHDFTNSSLADASGLDVAGINMFVGRPSDNTKLWNNIIYDVSNVSTNSSSDAMGIRLSAPGLTHYVYSNTVYDIRITGTGGDAHGIEDNGVTAIHAKNNYVGKVEHLMGGQQRCFNGTFLSENNNVSSDATAAGPGSQINQSAYASYFVSSTSGSENLHLLNDSNALWGSFGADLDSDPNLPVTDDIEADARDASTPDIGADEFTGAPSAGVIYYSVGTDNTALYSDTASASAGTLTLNSAAANNIGVGDEIREGANRYYITGRNSATEFTIQDSAANGGTPGDANITFASTAITIFRAFNTLTAAETGSSDANHLATADLVTGDFQLNWTGYNDAALDDMVLIDGYTTGAINYIHIYTPTATNEVGISQRHTGTAGTGFRIVPIDSSSPTVTEIIGIRDDDIRITGIEIDGSSITNAENILGIRVGSSVSVSGDLRFDKIIVHDLRSEDGSGSDADVAGVQFNNGSGKLSNSIIYDLEQTTALAAANVRGVATQGGSNHYLHNNTIFNIKNTGSTGLAEGVDEGGGTVAVKNTVALDVDSTAGAEACFSGTLTQSNNVSSDATAVGPQNQMAYASYFQNITDGSEDLHLLNDSNALWGSFGADLDADPDLPITDDADADARDASTPDIGADEFTGPGTGVIFYSVGTDNTALYSDTASASVGTLMLNSAAVDKIGVGDEIREGANRYYITGRNSSTEFTIQNSAANGGTPGDANITFASTAITIFRAFNTLTAAEAGSTDSNHLNTADLVAGNFQLNWTGYNDAALDDMVLIDGYTTGASNYIHIYTPTTTNQVGISQRHTGTAGTGFRLVPNTSTPPSQVKIIDIRDDDVRITGIEIDGSSITNAQNLAGIKVDVSVSASGDIQLNKIILHDLQSQDGTGGDADVNALDIANGNLRLSNSIIYDIAQTTANANARTRGVDITGGSNHYLHNNTLFNIKNSLNTHSAYGINEGGGTVTVKNTVVLDVVSDLGSDGCFNGTITQVNNVSSDATAVGPQNQTAYATYFQNISNGSENLHLRNDSNTLWGSFGADLDGDPNLPVTEDIDGDARDASTPDIGADEFTGAVGAGVVFYSVGVDNTALYSANASASAGTLTLSSAAADKIGVGDEIREGANRYYISGRSSATVFSIQNSAANGGTPGDTAITFASTAITIFRAFNDLDTATSGSADASHLNTSDLVAGDFQLNWACYNDGPDPSSEVRIEEPWVTGPANFIRVFTPTDTTQVGTSQRHTGVAGSGYRIVPSEDPAPNAFYNFIHVSTADGYVRIEGIEIDGSNVLNGETLRGLMINEPVGSSQDVRLTHNLIHDITNSTIDESDPSRVYGIYLDATDDSKVSNNIIYNINSVSAAVTGAHSYGIHADDAGLTHYVYNNTIYNIRAAATSAANTAVGIHDSQGNTFVVRNNYVGRVESTLGTEACFLGPFTAENNNVSSDATAAGTDSQTNQSAYPSYFVDTTGGTENLHLINDSNTLWGSFGADLDSDANLPVTDDIDADARDASTPDIGADEFSNPVVVTFYSVGTDNTALYSDTASASAGTLTLNSAAVDKIGVGDEIREGANRYYITGRNSATQFTIQNSAANGGTPGDTNITFASTAITIFRAFNTLSAAEAGSLDASHLNTADLVISNFQLNWTCYDDAALDDSVVINGYTTGPNNFIHIYTPTDATEVGVSQRHDGTAGTGFRMIPVINSPVGITRVLRVANDHVRITGIEMDGSSITDGQEIEGVSSANTLTAASDVRFTKLIVHDIHSENGSGSDADPIGIAIGGGNVKISNSIIYDIVQTTAHVDADARGIRTSGGSFNVYFHSNTIFNIKNTGGTRFAWGIQSSGGTVTATNNAVLDVEATSGTDGCFNGAMTQSNNVSSDGTAVGPQNQTAYATYFIDITDGNENLHLRADSNTLWGSFGTDLDNDPNLPVTDDIDGQARDTSTPDIGADELGSPGVVVVGYSVGTDNTALYSNNASASSGTLTLSSPAGDNIGVGDEIREGANRYYITGRSSATQFTIQNSAANGGTPGDTSISFASTAITIFRAFNSLTAAVAGSLDANHLNTSDLVLGGFQLDWTCYNDGPLNDVGAGGGVQIDGYTTGPSNYIHIYTPTVANEVGVSQRHTGIAGTGFRIVPVSSAAVNVRVINIFDDYVRITGVEIDGSSITNGLNIEGVEVDQTNSPSGDVRLSKLIVHDLRSENNGGADADVHAIDFDNGHGTLSNSIIYDIEQATTIPAADISGVSVTSQSAGSNIYLHNNTVFNIKNTGNNGDAWGVLQTVGNVTVKNTAALDVTVGGAGMAASFVGTLTQSNNVSSDATAVGPQNQSGPYSGYFVDDTDGNEDLHLLNDSNSLWGSFGADLDSDPNLAITDDFEGGARDANNPDIGADEFGAAPPALTLADHSATQVGDQFTNQTSVTDVLFRFSLSRSGTVTVDNIRVNFTVAGGVLNGDVSNGELYRDVNNNGLFDSGTDTLVLGSVTPVAGVLGFNSLGEDPGAGTNYIVRATVNSLNAGDTTTLSVGTADIDVVQVGVLESGSITNAVHTRDPGGVIYYSVGTDNTALYSDTASASTGVLTLNSAAANNIGVGDEIREGANRYYITGRNSSTEFTIQNSAANGGTPGDINISFASTAITIFRAFNTLTAAEANSSDGNHLNASDLVASNFQLNWACYDDLALNDTFIIDGYTTGANNYIHIYTPRAANEVGVSQRHTGTAGTGFRIVPITAAPADPLEIIDIRDDHVRITGIEIDGSSIANGRTIRGIEVDSSVAASGDLRFNKLIIHDLQSQDGTGSDADIYGFRLVNGNVNISNSIVYDLEQTTALNNASALGVRTSGGSNHYLHNNTIFNIKNTGTGTGTTYGVSSSGGTVTVKNTVALDVAGLGSVRCFDGTITQSNNVSSDATAVGPQNQTAYATYFIDITDGSENLHLRNDSNTLWGSFGADLDGDPDLPVTDDIDGEARDASTPDIGADEFSAAPTTNYRSIGPAVDYTVGTIDATDGSALITGTGTSWQTANRGRGDAITFPCPDPPTCTGGTDYAILSVDSETQLTLTAPVSGNFTGTYNIARQFDALQEWEDCISAGVGCVYFPVTGGDLVADDRVEVGIVYDDGVFALTSSVVIDDSTTDATHTITLTADGANRHYGVPGAGVIIDGQDAAREILVHDANVTIEWLEFIRVRGASFRAAIRVYGVPAELPPTNILLQNLLIHDFLDAAGDVSGIRLSGDPGKSVTIRNCMIWDGDIKGIEADEPTDTLIVENCSIDNMDSTIDNNGVGIHTSSTTVTVRNTIATNNPGGDFVVGGGGFSGASSNNTASDGTAPGAGAQTAAAVDLFVAPNSNLHLKSGAVAIDTAVDLSPSFSNDIDGDGRPFGLSWDRGADEFGQTYYRSIGTALDYTAGTIDATNGSAVVTGTGTTWQTTNRGRGDAITFPCPDPPTCTGGTDYTIRSVDSETQLTLTAPVSGNFTGTYNIARQFDTLQEWEDCISTGVGCVYFPVTGGDLVGDNREEVGIAYDDGVAFAELLIDDATTDANHTITLTVDPGNRHNGIAGQGVVLDIGPLGTVDAVRVRDDFVTVEWLEITGGQPTQGAEGIHVRAQNPSNQIILRNNLVHGVDGDGIVSAYEGVNIDIYNNIVYEGAANGIRINAVTPPHTGVMRILNNTVYNNTLRGIRSNEAGTGKLLQNNIAHSNSPGLDFSITGTLDPASSNNLASDTTGISHSLAGGGIDSVPLAGAGGVNFVSTAAGSEDLHITPASRAVGAAADLSGIFTDDIDGWTPRQAPWDIGADEVGGAATSPTNYRSIGSAPDYTAPGTIDATDGSNVVTGTGTTWLTANRGRGDVITFPCTDPPACTGGTDYTILSVDSNTQLTLTTPVTGNFTGTHQISRQFTALQDWETCISSGVGCVYFPVGGGDLVTDNRSEVGIAYDDGASFARVLIDGSITDATHTITLTVDPGNNRHYGIAGQGVVLDNGSDTIDAVSIQDDFVTVEWLEIQGGDIPSQPKAIRVQSLSVPNKIIVRNNLVHDVPEDGISTAEADLVMDAYNNIIYTTADDGISIGGTLGAGAQIRLLNNTIYNCVDQGITSAVGDHSTVTVQNNIAFCTGNDFNITLPVNPASSNNLSGDGTATARSPAGGDRPNVALGDIQFVNTAGPIDLHIQSGSLLGAEDGGVDLSSIFNLDIDAGARTTPWEIGADDIAATTAVELVSFEAFGVDGAVELRWETGSELDNLGFHLYRSLTEEGPFDQITTSVIPGLGSSPEGAKYAYRDSGLTNGVTYFYKLEDIETTGATELHGPVSATPTTEVVVEGDTGGGEDSTGEDLGELSSRITYGDPSANELKIRRKGKKWMELTLITEGFYAIPQEDGSVLLEVPGFEDFGGPDLPDVPAYRTWQDVRAGRNVQLAGVSARQVAEFASLRPSSSELVVVASGDGTVQTSRRRRRRRRPRHVYYPESWAQLMNVGFQGASKKALVEMAPLRWDATAEKLVLAKRLVVRISFKGKDKAELKLGKSHREVDSHLDRNVLARIAVTEPGLYGVSFESVFGRKGKARKTKDLSLSRHGEPVAFFVTPNRKKFKRKSTLYFVSEGSELNPYGSEAVYELLASRAGTPMGLVDGRPVGAPTSFYWKTVEREENLLYQAAFENEESIWQWDWLFGPMTNSYPFEVENLSSAPENSKLRVWLHGASDFPEDPDHHVRLYVNGTLITETWWDGETPHFVDAELGPGLLLEGENSLEIEEVGDTEAEYSMVMLDRFEVSYPAQLTNELEGSFTQPGVATLPGATGHLFDMTEAQPRRLAGVQSGPGGLSFEALSDHRYLFASEVLTPEVRRAPSTGLKAAWSRAEYLVIGPREFLEAAEPLLAHRREEGLISGGVATEDIYDEFGFGEATPESIKDFLSYVYHHWSEPTLRYVVLLGDGTYDTKDYLATGVTSQVPVKILKTQFVWTASDPWYGAINGDDVLPDVAIGRLPAASVGEVEKLVQKILDYETNEGDPEAPVVLVADNPDHGGDFVANAEELATTVLSGQELDELYLSELGTAATRSEILNAFDSGASLISYMGHGAIHLWGNENLLNIWDVDSLSPQTQQPLLLTMNCLNGYFHFPYFNSLSEELLKAEGKGVIAAFSPTGFSLNSPAHRFHEAILEQVVNQNHGRLGDALLAAQGIYAHTGSFPELITVYHLLGDPALRLR